MPTKDEVSLLLKQLGTALVLLFIIDIKYYFSKIPALRNFFMTNSNDYGNYLVSNYSNHNEFFIGVALAILGTIAIAFSFSIFSIQYAADKGTTKVLEEYRNDPLYVRSFFAISAFALIILSFSIIQNGPKLILIKYGFSFLFLIITIYLLFRLLRHTARLVDPRYRVDRSYEKIRSYFSQLSSQLDKVILANDNSRQNDNDQGK